jgi:signal transduction histidine kinase
LEKSNSIPEKVEFELNQMVYTLSLVASLILIVMGVMVVLIFKDKTESLILASMSFFLIVTPFYRTLLILRFKRQKHSRPTKYWVNRFLWSTSLIGLVWGLSLSYFYIDGSTTERLFILVSTASMSAAGAFLYGPNLVTALIYIISSITPVSFVLLIDTDIQIKALGIFSLFYLGILLQGCWVYYSKTKSSFWLQFEKEDLVDKVNQQNQQILNEQAKTIHSSRLAALGEMSAGIAHEINNPMTVILAVSEKIGRIIDDKEALAKNITRLQTNSKRVIKIINSLRSFSRADDTEKNEKVPIQSLILETMDLCSARIISNGIRIDYDIPNEEIMVLCKSIQISQVILNIVNNAHDAIMEIQDAKDDYKIKIKVEKEENNKVHISISNNGPAIPESLLNRIFEPFYTSKDIGKGTGLGLSLSKGIIEDHSGTLTVNSNSQETNFVITLPIAS